MSSNKLNFTSDLATCPQLDWRAWKGFEAEGPYVGMPTVFVAAFDHLEDLSGQHVYLLARGWVSRSEEAMNIIRKWLDAKCFVTIEIPNREFDKLAVDLALHPRVCVQLTCDVSKQFYAAVARLKPKDYVRMDADEFCNIAAKVLTTTTPADYAQDVRIA